MAKKNLKKTKSKIVSAAWKLFYEQGYEDTTIEEIIEESGTSKGSFYHYFEGKDAFFDMTYCPECSKKSQRAVIGVWSFSTN